MNDASQTKTKSVHLQTLLVLMMLGGAFITCNAVERRVEIVSYVIPHPAPGQTLGPDASWSKETVFGYGWPFLHREREPGVQLSSRVNPKHLTYNLIIAVCTLMLAARLSEYLLRRNKDKK
jgi:hypothetical protein